MWINPEHNEEIGMMRATQSASGKCHTFDAKADGYVKAEAINAVFLKRLDDAVRDGDPIRAIIRGTSTNSAGRTPGLASPSSEAQAAAIRAAYANAGISKFSDTGYLECHGTGTLAGDPVEVTGASAVFAAQRTEDLIVGSIKSNIGHSEAAAGISALIKAILAVERGLIPGNPTFVDPNPNIDFKGLQIKATKDLVQWPLSAKRRASVNSFGFGGANAHVVLDAANHSPHVSSYIQNVGDDFFDLGDDEEISDVRPHLFVFSANDEKSLKDSVKSLAGHLLNPGVSVNLNDLAYTLSERRSRHYCRAFGISKTASISQESLVFGKKMASPRPAFVFTGQGAQWSEMGRDLVKLFPTARRVLQHLDTTLQKLPLPPTWSIIEELTEPRAPEILRQPEFSQPLVTALQLAIVQIFKEWNITPISVVGHSSGEIAAAAAAGLITFEDAITVAFYRGQAAKDSTLQAPLGMLAVGIGADEVAPYLDDAAKGAQIACYNSPNSLTLSGPVSALKGIEERLKEAGHFARLLQVDLAYHSEYMTNIGETYESILLGRQLPTATQQKPDTAVKMFSSVTGQLLDTLPNAAYWKRNMVQPVRFSQAASSLLQDQDAANFMIEIGPSNALSGPLSQIKKGISGDASSFQYVSALKRGNDAALHLFDVAGRLFLAGGSVDIKQVNHDNTTSRPAVIVDLPNYSWNHSTSYWHEPLASKDWRFKKFINHDLLGSKMLGSPWPSPIFQKTLKLADMPWLEDHKLGNQVVFPGAGYVAMALEAAYQTAMVTEWKETAPTKYRYRLRDVKFSRAMVLERDVESRFTLSLTPVPGTTRSWYEFRVSSQRDSMWTEHSTGLIRIEASYPDEPSPSAATEPLRFPKPASSWYKAMADAGYNFGTAFQKHLEVESTTGKRESRSLVSLEPPTSTYGQSFYPMHPACIDGCFQTVSPALWEGDRTSVGAVLVPAVISSLLITARQEQPVQAISVASAKYLGIGRTDSPRNYGTDCSVYDPATGNLLLEMKGLQFGEVETSEEEVAGHTFTHLSWDVDISALLQQPGEKLLEFLNAEIRGTPAEGKDDEGGVEFQPRDVVAQRILDLIAHKQPVINVLELNLEPSDNTSLWLQATSQHSKAMRAANARYHLTSTDSNTLVNMQEQFSSPSSSQTFGLIDRSKPILIADDCQFEVAIIKSSPSVSYNDLRSYIDSVLASMTPGGYLVFVQDESAISADQIQDLFGDKTAQLQTLRHDVCLGKVASPSVGGYFTGSKPISHVSLTNNTGSQVSEDICRLLRGRWNIQRSVDPGKDIAPGQAVLVTDEVVQSVMDSLDDSQWQLLQHLIQTECNILWVTTGAQLSVTDPTKAAINGFFRVLRAEEPRLRLVTLDVEDTDVASVSERINACLALLDQGIEAERLDSEYVERQGVLQISRVVPNEELTQLQSDEISDFKTETVELHTSESCIRLRAERLGNVDAIHYGELSADSLPLRDGHIEVELYAAGMNYKDVVVTMGIVPGNEHTLGGEGSGIVTRVARDVTSFEPGQRVVVFDKGTFANRIQTTPGRAHRIPDWMSFEEASTLSAVYLTSIYSLFDMANLVSGQRVLVHSAAGGVGIASIQLCQYAGAELFVTVGTEEKRDYLKTTFGITDDHIFSSRTAEFARQILAATSGRGVDIILNSLTGDLLDESWRILADGGTLVEIGKKDILDRNSLSMEPFDRNISFRAVDMSHERAPDHLVSRLMTKLFELVNEGHVRPIAPIHRFSFSDVPSAIRFLRAGKHIGKVVISDGPTGEPTVQVRRAPKAITFRNDRCYLIVGGLKGLCGSLAVYLAKSGAKHLAVISRSGHCDEKSRGVIEEIKALGSDIYCLTADVAIAGDVERAFRSTQLPIAGVIQGAMVLRDRTFSSMTIDEYHAALACKIRGTWNLHNAAEKLGLELDFFTMLSSISGVVGQKGQANYAAGNAFLDSFASYRQQRGQPAVSVDLGVIEDVGYIHEKDGMQQKLDTSIWTGINERLLRKIVYLSILQQQQQAGLVGPSAASSAQMITGIPVPQPERSQLLPDARFAALFSRSGNGGGGAGVKDDSGSKDVQALLILLRSGGADLAAQVAATVNVVGQCVMRVLRLSEPMETSRPLSVYGIHSLAAVEMRNWIRAELGALVTTLDIMNATSLDALCKKIVLKLTATSIAEA
ncbi:hypothetical protein SGCOL_002986 [Colletotrichum sp. CLE4]